MPNSKGNRITDANRKKSRIDGIASCNCPIAIYAVVKSVVGMNMSPSK